MSQNPAGYRCCALGVDFSGNPPPVLGHPQHPRLVLCQDQPLAASSEVLVWISLAPAGTRRPNQHYLIYKQEAAGPFFAYGANFKIHSPTPGWEAAQVGQCPAKCSEGVIKQRVLSGWLLPLLKTISVLLCWFGEPLWVRIPGVGTLAFWGRWAGRFEGGVRGVVPVLVLSCGDLQQGTAVLGTIHCCPQ